MALSRLVYISEATRPMTLEQLRALVNDAAANNATRGITGLLVSGSSHFLQILEGEELPVQSVFRKIEGDSRHRDIRTLLFRAAECRIFPRWSMCLAKTDQFVLDSAAMDKALIRLRLDPQDAEREAMAILGEFRRQLEGSLAKSA